MGQIYDALKRAEKAAADRRQGARDPTVPPPNPMLTSGILKPRVDYKPVSRTRTVNSADSVRALNVFLCHSSKDKTAVRNLYGWLQSTSVHPWLDEEELLPGHNWEFEISKAVKNTDVVIVCLSKEAVSKRGFVQKELKFALDIADLQPEGAIFLIPLKLEDCDVPERLRRWHWVNLYDQRGYDLLIRSLQSRAQALKVTVPSSLR